MNPASKPARSAGADHPRLSRLLEGYSVEITTHDAGVIAGLGAGAEVFVASLPKDRPGEAVEAAARLRRAGFEPVPHLTARKLVSHREFDNLVARLAGEAGVERVLALGGDRDDAAGPFPDALALVESDVLARHGIRHVSIGCYPEGHPRIGEAHLRRALHDKLAAIAARGMEARLVSQFVFEPEPVVAFARSLRADGITAPLRVGVAGPAGRAALIRYAMRCGVGASLRALTGGTRLVTGLLGAVTPQPILAGVAEALAADPALGIEGVHFFSFGGPRKTIEWAQGQSR